MAPCFARPVPGATPADAPLAPRRRLLGLLLAPPLSAALAGCAPLGGASPQPEVSHWSAAPGRALLVGEVHDNAQAHALRHRALATLLARGERPALLFEQFDREQQGPIDRWRASAPGAGTPQALQAQADALIDAAGRAKGWHWPFYRPDLVLALQHGLPIVAANVSRSDARQVIARGLAATGWQDPVPADIARAQARAIEDSHCGQVDAAMAAKLAQAQIARDQQMARLVAAHAPRGVVLLAGHGHVRRDIGVPRWLAPALAERSLVVGLLDAADPPTSPTSTPGADPDDTRAFDQVLHLPAPRRPDPCAGLRIAPPARSSG